VSARRARLQESWILLRRNRLALAGMVIFLLFFAVAVAGMFLTTGTSPALDPNLVRLRRSSGRPVRANLDSLRPEEVPKSGVYLLGTDELGRMCSRACSRRLGLPDRGFVAVGIAVAIGVVLGGLAGYFAGARSRWQGCWRCSSSGCGGDGRDLPGLFAFSALSSPSP